MNIKARTAEPLPCSECGETRLVSTVENCRLEDGLTIRRLRHFKCLSCDARFFDTAAMHRIQEERKKQSATSAV